MEENISERKPVRVRFAPSPTGKLHIGGIRTALFNYIFALQNSGKLILRIDDTDTERSRKEFEDSIISDLAWFNIVWDEFYKQSERMEFYEKYLNELREKNLVYECFCSESDILRARELAVKTKKPYVYGGKCLKLSNAEKERLTMSLKEKGLKPSIRFNVKAAVEYVSRINNLKNPTYAIEFKDMVHGFISIKSTVIGDFIIKTEDGRFTYNFASSIDDGILGITHIIRGEDHISNTPKQILLLNALDIKSPIFAHISLLYGKDGKLMSKRDKASDMDYYKSAGFLPNAVLNYLAITGNTFLEKSTSRSEDRGDRIAEKEIFLSPKEMPEFFNIGKASGSGAIFNEDKLLFINEKHLELITAEKLLNILKNKFNENETIAILEKNYGSKGLLDILSFLKSEFKTVTGIIEGSAIFRNDFKVSAQVSSGGGTALKKSLITNIEALPGFDENYLKQAIKKSAVENEAQLKNCYEMLRVLITGKTDGPSILKIMKYLGKNKTLERLSA